MKKSFLGAMCIAALFQTLCADTDTWVVGGGIVIAFGIGLAVRQSDINLKDREIRRLIAELAKCRIDLKNFPEACERACNERIKKERERAGQAATILIAESINNSTKIEKLQAQLDTKKSPSVIEQLFENAQAFTAYMKDNPADPISDGTY